MVRSLRRLSFTALVLAFLTVSLLWAMLILATGYGQPLETKPLSGQSETMDRPTVSNQRQVIQDRLPAELYPAVVAALQEDGSGYHDVVPVEGPDGKSGDTAWTTKAYQAVNLGHDFKATFTPRGVRLLPLEGRAWSWGFSLTAIGYGDQLLPLPTPDLAAVGNRVEYRFGGPGGLTEWYVNGPLGLEQGFTLKTRPTGTLGSCALIWPSPGI